MANTKPEQKFHLIIAAAGKGERFGGALPKQYVKINGKSILRHTLDNALRWPGIASVRVIIDPEHADLYHDTVHNLDLAPPVNGGLTRKQSIYNALKSISKVNSEEIVLVHDAARPCTRPADISALLQALGQSRAATLAAPITDTLRRDDKIVDRNRLWAVQTPQAFYLGDLTQAHENANDDHDYTDDTSLVSALGIEVKLVEACRSNIKITTADDLRMVEALLARNTETRTAMGFDVHAFDQSASGKPLILCGVEIPHDHPLAGHSDADVGLHALTDALLGTIGEGDIGTHFPPSNPAFKDMESSVFLNHAVKLLERHGGSIVNLDLTLICEAPKIGPHAATMKQRIASIIKCDPTRISIKATTTEKLGFTGRGEGIAAQAVATVKIHAPE